MPRSPPCKHLVCRVCLLEKNHAVMHREFERRIVTIEASVSDHGSKIGRQRRDINQITGWDIVGIKNLLDKLHSDYDAVVGPPMECDLSTLPPSSLAVSDEPSDEPHHPENDGDRPMSSGEGNGDDSRGAGVLEESVTSDPESGEKPLPDDSHGDDSGGSVVLEDTLTSDTYSGSKLLPDAEE